MKYHRLMLLVLLWLFVQVGNAQDDIPFPPEDPKTLFSDAVEIVDVRLDSLTLQFAQPIIILPDYRTLYRNDGREYPFPPELSRQVDEGAIVSGTHSDGQVYITARIDTLSGAFEQYWILDLETGNYRSVDELPEYVNSNCGMYPLATIGHVIWTIITGDDGQQHACNMNNGMRTPPLPDGYEGWEILSSITPNYLWLVAHPIDASETARTLFVFAFSTYEIFAIGDFTGDASIYRIPVNYDNSFVLYALDADSRVTAVYWADVPSRSIHEAMLDAHYVDDPPRFFTWHETDDGAAREGTILNISTGEQIAFGYEGACNIEYSHTARNYFYHSGSYFYCRVLNEDNTEADVVRINSITGESEVIYTGEVEQIKWVSEDHRYMQLLIDDSGTIDTGFTEEELRRPSFESTVARMIIIDLSDGDIIYDVAAYRGGVSNNWQPAASMLADNWIQTTDYSRTDLIHLVGEDVIVSELPGAHLGRDLGNGWTVMYLNQQYVQATMTISFNLYNLETRTLVPVFQLPYDPFNYALTIDYFQPLEDGLFQVVIGYHRDDSAGDPFRLYNLAVYRIRIAGVDLEAP
jgi:hypothetical protein